MMLHRISLTTLILIALCSAIAISSLPTAARASERGTFWVAGSLSDRDSAIGEQQRIFARTGMEVTIIRSRAQSLFPYLLLVRAADTPPNRELQRTNLEYVGVQEPWLIRLDLPLNALEPEQVMEPALQLADAPTESAPQVAPPAIAASEAVVPDAVIPEAVVPEAVVPDTVVPEAVVPEAVVPEAVVPDAVVPEAVVPEAVVPDTVVPEAVVPEPELAVSAPMMEAQETLEPTEPAPAVEQLVDATTIIQEEETPPVPDAVVPDVVAPAVIVPEAVAPTPPAQREMMADAAALLESGIASLERRRYQDAVDKFTRALSAGGNDERLYYYRGRANTLLRNYELAIQDFDRAIQVNPQYSDAYNQRGLAHQRTGDKERALRDYKRALEIDPANSSAIFNRSRTFLFQILPVVLILAL